MIFAQVYDACKGDPRTWLNISIWTSVVKNKKRYYLSTPDVANSLITYDEALAMIQTSPECYVMEQLL